jgi:hypothetical protein
MTHTHTHTHNIFVYFIGFQIQITTLEQRTALLTNTERLNRIGADITHSNQIGQAALQTGVATLQELQIQGERIQHSRAGVSSIQNQINTQRSCDLLSSTYQHYFVCLLVCLFSYFLLFLFIFSFVRSMND